MSGTYLVEPGIPLTHKLDVVRTMTSAPLVLIIVKLWGTLLYVATLKDLSAVTESSAIMENF